MAALTTKRLRDDGTVPTFGAASASDTAEVGTGMNRFAWYRNTTGAPVTVTVAVPGETFFGTPTTDNVVTVPANGQAMIPLRRGYGVSGRATLALSDATGVEVAIVGID